MLTSYDTLLHKLDEFIRKYYRNQLIRGGIYFTAAVLVSFLVVVVLEYFGRYSPTVRAGLFWSFTAFSAYCLVRFILIPLARLYRIGKRLGYEQASAIIGTHFPEVRDRLLNTLQLQRESANTADASLIHAAIDQKIGQLKPVPFTAAIDMRRNLRYLKYAGLPLLVYAIIYLIAPGMISDSSRRIIRYNETFKPLAPFSFEVLNPDLKAQQFSDFELSVKVSGTQIPEEVYVVINDNPYRMQKSDKVNFTYTFTNLQKSTPFHLQADVFESDAYTLEVLARPLLVNYEAHLDYPGYTGKKDETLSNPGDLHLPAGTTVSWKFITSHTDDVELGFNGQVLKAGKQEDDVFTFSKKFFLSSAYYIRNMNAAIRTRDSMAYNIEVVPDAFPSITVDEKADSLTGRQVYFIGDASDDYGLTKLAFVYRFVKSDDRDKTAKGAQVKLLAVSKGLSHRFYHQFDLGEAGVSPADEVEYYFEVWDNDGVHGSKSSRSKTMLFKAPSLNELEEKTEAGNAAMKEKMEEALKESKSLQKEMKDLERKMMDKKELTWEEKKKLDELLQREKELQKKIAEIKDQHEQNNRQESEYKKQSEDILEKQKQLEQMFNNIANDEMKKLMQQLEKMMQMQNKDQIRQEMDKMKLSNKDVEKELDRMLEQFRHMEIEKKMEEAISKLDKLAEKQEQLSKETEQAQDKKQTKEEKQKTQEELKEKQENLQKEFEDIKNDLKDIQEKNSKLEDPKDLEKTGEEQKDVDEEMNNSEEELKKNDNKKASGSQKEAADKMKKMSDKMKKGMEEEEEKELDIDIDAMREILENTVQLSKDQEELMEKMKQVSGYSPQYVDIAQQQKKVKDNAKIIEDSLLSLSKRVMEIKSFVNREVSRLNDNLDKSIKGFGQRNFMEIRTRQQYAMTHANNLAVMLSDILGQMQAKQQDGKSKKSGTPKKPGKGKGKGQGQGSKPSMGQMKKMQEEMNRQLREGLNKNGSSPKDGQQGKPQNGQGNQGGGMSSEQFARMAAQQQAIRQQLQQMMQQMGSKEKEGLGGGAKLQELQKLMEQTEKELFNKRLSGELLMRQQDILTRLLESEKAERRQEQDNRREAEQAKEKPRAAPPDFEKYIRQKDREKELLETIPPELQPYYREKAREYFNRIGGQ